MRDILFRGKRKDNGEWTEGHYAKVVDWLDERYIDLIIESKATQFHHSELTSCNEVELETVGQFTGLLDKNGKKIFEGDIVEGRNWLHEDRLIYRVVWELNGFYYCDEDDERWHPGHINEVEVIGNIHDNPELLEVK